MKRIGYLYERIFEPENLRLAFWKAQRGKSAKRAIQLFREDLQGNLERIRLEFENRAVRFGDCHYFPVYDPKKRIICAAAFRERVQKRGLSPFHLDAMKERICG